MAQYQYIMIGEKAEKKFLGLRYQAVQKNNVYPQNLEKCLSDFFLAQRSPLLFICPDNQKFSDGIRKGNVQYIYHAAGLKNLDKNQREFQAGLKNILDRRITVPATQAAFLPIGYYGPIDHFPGGEFTIDLDEIAAKIEIFYKE